MSNPPNLDHDSNNTGNQYGPYNPQSQYFQDFSSMSTLASAAHAQGQQPQPHEVHGHPGNAAFQELEAQLALYGNLNPHHPAQDFSGYGPAAPLNGGHLVGGYGRPATGFDGWYGQPISHSLQGFLESYQNIPEQQPPPHGGDILRNGHPPPVAGTLSHLQPVEAGPEPEPEEVVREPSREVSKELVVEQSSTQLEPRETPQIPRPDISPSTQSVTAPAVSAVVPTQQPVLSHNRTIPDRSSTKTRDDFRPKISIPSHVPPEEYARQCILAAFSSRLNPFALHPDEYQLLRDHINHLQATGYLNIRNGILRLWMNNPLVSVTREEAAGCAKDYRWFDVADVAYQWLVRKGYINYGCAEVPGVGDIYHTLSHADESKRKTIVVVGAGMAGLGCARQLEGLFTQLGHLWVAKGELMPKIVVLEGRGRIGGRVYSHPLKKQSPENLPAGLRCTADLGAQIITGFDNGNPLSAIIRGQLALHYHSLTDNSTLYDVDGTAVDKNRDQLVERLYNDILERVSSFRNPRSQVHTVEGDKELIELGRDPTGEGGKVISAVEGAAASLPTTGARTGAAKVDKSAPVSATVDKLTGRAHVSSVQATRLPAAEVASKSGWPLKPNIDINATLDLGTKARQMAHPTLGSVMDDAVKQYQDLIELTSQDLRMLNWHFANLEYANAVNVNDLSLGGWDQDIDNEFEGEHAQIVGGYMQVPRAIWQYPTKLDVRTRRVVRRISYHPDRRQKARVECDDGDFFDADEVVVTVPLGVLKSRSVQFDPPLPDWKTGAIERLGFGTLNKVVLVFEKAFWDEGKDMFGLLRDSVVGESLKQPDYESRRGRFYLFWNCSQTSGRPTLVALMAGDAAHQTEASMDQDLITEVKRELGKIYGPRNVPEPSEVIISRWGKDRFARGSYSYVGSQTHPDDYDNMAKAIGNLHFAGEATCGTHPATVHGAYLSGLRAASEAMEWMIGPIKIPTPLLPPKAQFELGNVTTGKKRKADESAVQRLRVLKETRLAAYETEVYQVVLERLGERPTKPEKSGANPFLLYQKDHWHICKQKCDDARKQATKNPDAKATRNEVRAALGQMWREAPDEQKKPYLDQTASNKQSNTASAAEFKEKVEQWDRSAEAIRKEYREKHPSRPQAEEQRLQAEVEQELGGASGRTTKRLNGDVDMPDVEMVG